MIYIIKRIDFDWMENHNPRYEIVLGYCNNEEYAKSVIEKLDSKHEKSKEWDGEFYPKFIYQGCYHIDENKPLKPQWLK